MGINKILATIIISCILSCSSPYQRRGLTGGYTDEVLDQNTFGVTFTGTKFTSREKIADFALLRSAELTIEKGFSHFSIISKTEGDETSTFVEPANYNTRMVGTSQVHLSGNPGVTRTVKLPFAFYTIRCFDRQVDQETYQASSLRDELRSKYQVD